ncbi:MAG: hypothetical protein ACJASQ_002816 [Crocinitomicaceae bacterium]|jgi:hypothetical protein
MSDTLDEINTDQGGFAKPIVFVLIGILFYNGLLYAEPTLLSVEYYFYEWGLPNHLHYWMIFLLKYFICLIIANFAGNWIIKKMNKLSSVRLLIPFSGFFLLSFALNWIIHDYYEDIYGPKSESYYVFWDFIHEFYNHDWVRRIVNFVIMLTIGILYWDKAKKWNRQ